MLTERKSGKSVDQKIINNLIRNYPINNKDAEVGETLINEGEYQGYFSTLDLERVIAQITYVFMAKRGNELRRELSSIPLFGRKARSALVHNVLLSQVAEDKDSNELNVNLRARVKSPVKLFFSASYPLINDTFSQTIKTDLNKLKVRTRAKGMVGKVALGIINVEEELSRELLNINSLVEQTLAIPLGAYGVKGKVSVNKLEIDTQDSDRLLFVHLNKDDY